MNLYNEHDKPTATWLRELAWQSLIPHGHVDDRDIQQLTSADLQGFTQCHFFAGIGGWSEALRLAGWPTDRPVWTGSCPCQPFSVAGKGAGTADPRHLWPEFLRLITECRPSTVFGEQVASVAGRQWLAGVRADLEALGYAVGAADLCAAGLGAPHIRQRLYWVANAGHQQPGRPAAPGEAKERRAFGDSTGCRVAGGLAHTLPARRPEGRPGSGCGPLAEGCCTGGVGHSILPRLEGGNTGEVGNQLETAERTGQTRGPGAVHQNHWSKFDVLHCTDGKARRIEPGTFPLAHGIPARVVRLRGYGNAIVPQVAAEFVKAFMEVVK